MDSYIASLIAVAGTILGGVVGAFLGHKFRKEELNRIEAFQTKLSDQNEKLLTHLSENEIAKTHQFGSAVFDGLTKISGAIEKKN